MIIRKKVVGVSTVPQLSDKSLSPNIELHELTDDEYDACLVANRKFYEFLAAVRLYNIVEWNYQDYHKIVEFFRNLNSRGLQIMLRRNILSLDINRVLLNFLASVRMYLDHTETYIKRRYGDNSPNWMNYKDACSKAYDEIFSYRFLSQLRNYAQHCGLPVNYFHVKSGRTPERIGEASPELIFGLERDFALRDFKWKKLHQELAQKTDVIEVDEHVHILMESIRQINQVFAEDELAYLRPKAAYVDELAKRFGFSDEAGELGIYEPEFEEDERGELILRVLPGSRIPMEIVYAILDNNLDEILLKYFSSEIAEDTGPKDRHE